MAGFVHVHTCSYMLLLLTFSNVMTVYNCSYTCRLPVSGIVKCIA